MLRIFWILQVTFFGLPDAVYRVIRICFLARVNEIVTSPNNHHFLSTLFKEISHQSRPHRVNFRVLVISISGRPFVEEDAD